MKTFQELKAGDFFKQVFSGEVDRCVCKKIVRDGTYNTIYNDGGIGHTEPDRKVVELEPSFIEKKLIFRDLKPGQKCKVPAYGNDPVYTKMNATYGIGNNAHDNKYYLVTIEENAFVEVIE